MSLGFLHKWSTKTLYIVNFLLFYYGLLFFCVLNGKVFSLVHPLYFRNTDNLSEIALILLGIPQWFVSHPSFFNLLDVGIFLFPVLVFSWYWRKKKFSVLLGLCFTVFFFLYFLLNNLFFLIALEGIIPIFFYTLLFWANKEKNWNLGVNVVRYQLLYLMFTAGVWKVCRGAVFSTNVMSNILIAQHVDLLVDKCSFFQCGIYEYLIEHPTVAQILYASATGMELLFGIGFFTKKYDKWLAALLLLFIIGDHFIMRIPYWILLLPAITLWLPKQRGKEVSPAA